MTSGLRITEVERITLLVPFRPRVEPWLNLLNFQWGIVEICRVVTDAGFVGYGETLPHYTYGKVTDAAVERVDLGPGLSGHAAAPSLTATRAPRCLKHLREKSTAE